MSCGSKTKPIGNVIAATRAAIEVVVGALTDTYHVTNGPVAWAATVDSSATRNRGVTSWPKKIWMGRLGSSGADQNHAIEWVIEMARFVGGGAPRRKGWDVEAAEALIADAQKLIEGIGASVRSNSDCEFAYEVGEGYPTIDIDSSAEASEISLRIEFTATY